MTETEYDYWRNPGNVVKHLVSNSGFVGTIWLPGDGTEYRVGLSRITCGSYQGDHVLVVTVAQTAYAIYLGAPWHDQPSAAKFKQLGHPDWLWPAVEPLIKLITAWKADRASVPDA